ncbi:hypothetical protein B0O80DRAFT_221418 [Mortierella sp. GBAus27b]|nr:hypothetical protein B0O80DRAFT_221418 [Mortierella sp. GBAus27b]
MSQDSRRGIHWRRHVTRWETPSSAMTICLFDETCNSNSNYQVLCSQSLFPKLKGGPIHRRPTTVCSTKVLVLPSGLFSAMHEPFTDEYLSPDLPQKDV